MALTRSQKRLMEAGRPGLVGRGGRAASTWGGEGQTEGEEDRGSVETGGAGTSAGRPSRPAREAAPSPAPSAASSTPSWLRQIVGVDFSAEVAAISIVYFCQVTAASLTIVAYNTCSTSIPPPSRASPL